MQIFLFLKFMAPNHTESKQNQNGENGRNADFSCLHSTVPRSQKPYPNSYVRRVRALAWDTVETDKKQQLSVKYPSSLNLWLPMSTLILFLAMLACPDCTAMTAKQGQHTSEDIITF